MEEVGAHVKGYGTGGCVYQKVGDLLQDIGTGSSTIQVGDVGGISAHREDARRFSPPGDMQTDREADEM